MTGPHRAPQHPDPRFYLEERYVGGRRRSPLLPAYYAVKHLVPRRLQLAARRAYARRQASREFPAWPVESILVDRQRDEFRRRVEERGGDPVAFVNFWPEGRRFAFVLTHDVEGTAGVDNIDRVLEVERRHGFVSSWNFVAEAYPIPGDVFDRVRAGGCEVGLHGITHDGRLFRSRRHFEEQLPKVHRYLREWDVVGFRSPATHRNAAWMPELGCLYDSSFPDTDPFEPQSGGCCSIHPFFLGDMVELPITLVQDHTMWEILRDPSIDRWLQKSRWIIEQHGLVNVIVHPDYVRSDERLARYDAFLAFLAAQSGGWHALPRDVASWWAQRAELSVTADGDSIAGASRFRPTVARARRDPAAGIVFDVEG